MNNLNSKPEPNLITKYKTLNLILIILMVVYLLIILFYTAFDIVTILYLFIIIFTIPGLIKMKAIDYAVVSIFFSYRYFEIINRGDWKYLFFENQGFIYTIASYSHIIIIILGFYLWKKIHNFAPFKNINKV